MFRVRLRILYGFVRVGVSFLSSSFGDVMTRSSGPRAWEEETKTLMNGNQRRDLVFSVGIY